MKNLNFETKSKSDLVQLTFFSWPIKMSHQSNFTCLSLPFVKERSFEEKMNQDNSF